MSAFNVPAMHSVPKQIPVVGQRKGPKWNALIDLGIKSGKIKNVGTKMEKSQIVRTKSLKVHLCQI